MTDPRVAKLARLLVTYSLRLKKGEILRINGEVVSLPLAKAVFEAAIEAGAYPYIALNVPEAEEMLLKKGSADQLSFFQPVHKLEFEKVDAFMTIWGSENLNYLSGVDPKRQAAKQKARGPHVKKLFARLAARKAKWVGTQFPTMADAQKAGMSLADYETFVFEAGHIHAADPAKHWQAVEKEQVRLKKILDAVDQLHVRSTDTDLKLRVAGRKWISCHGDQNFPDGEIFTCPVETSVEGTIRFSYPAVYGGREVENVRLTLRKGRVISEAADKNQAYLTAMLNMDKGARTVGEFAVGTNYEIKRFTGNTLFDEKIGGTCHMAMGAAFPEAGGKNNSGLHWDMVCDMNQGEITADGKTIYRNGRFTI